jgi:hypothetical protein
MKSKNQQEWLLLVHQLPPNPTNLRVRTWRKLQTLGAVPIKNSVYVLPFNEKTNEDFQWLKQEIESAGGEASLFRAAAVEGASDQEIIGLFQEQRNQDYEKLTADLMDLTGALREQGKNNSLSAAKLAQYETELGKLRQELERVLAVDFFQASNGKKAQTTFEKCLGQLQRVKSRGDKETENQAVLVGGLNPAEYQNRRWVTRSNPHIDRLACGWLIRRFIDQRPRFLFVGAEAERIENCITFDMTDGDFTHEGEDCSFETMVRKFGLAENPALREIAEIVHDIDVKDGKFNRLETTGVNAVIRGLAEVYRDDSERMKECLPVFDGLYELFGADSEKATTENALAKKKQGGKQNVGRK